MANGKPGGWQLWVGIVALLIISLAGLVAAVRMMPKADEPVFEKEDDTTKQLRGFSLSPKSFEVADYRSFFDDVTSHGNTLSWAGNYADLSKTTGNAAKTVLQESEKKNLTPVLITGPNKNEVFDGIFVQGFRDAVVNFVSANEVPYLGLGNEIDEVYLDSPARYAALMSTLKSVAAEVKAVSPNTTVFTVFQLERIKGLQGGLFGGESDQSRNNWNLVEGLVGFDMVAFTTYPCLIYRSPSDIPEEYYSDITNQTKLPVAFTEIGWFRDTPAAGWESDETEQAAFITRFDELTTRTNPKLVIWPFLYDQPIKKPFEKMGLLGLNQTTSLSLTAWDQYRKESIPE